MATALIIIAAVVIAGAGLLAAAFLYSIVLPRQPFRGPLPMLDGEAADLTRRLERHVRAVASQPHNVAHYEALEHAARYVERELGAIGYTPLLHRFVADGRSVRNVEIIIEPSAPAGSQQTFVIGAHYDSSNDSPGAHDNGTGVAVLLELARLLAPAVASRRRLRLVFFVNEEQPYGKTPLMGSWRHARDLAEAGEKVAGMIALETLGYFSDEPGSQKFPAPFGLVYPPVGNFVAFVGLPGSRRFLHRAIGAFRRHAAFPSIGGVAPGFIEGIDLSDHWAYAQFGFPALMLTDTAPFRNPYYHERDDLPETVDYRSLARITRGLEKMVRELIA